MAFSGGSGRNKNNGQTEFDYPFQKGRLDFSHDGNAPDLMDHCPRGREAFHHNIVLRTDKNRLYPVLVQVIVQALVYVIEKIALVGQLEGGPQYVANGFGLGCLPDGIHAHSPGRVTVANCVIPYSFTGGLGNSFFSAVQHHRNEGLGITELLGNVHLRNASMGRIGHSKDG